jgi:hypothetical protein
MNNEKTIYLCLRCIQYAPCNCIKQPVAYRSPVSKTRWTHKVVYDIKLTEEVSYGAVDEEGNPEVEDRDECVFFDMASCDEAIKYYNEFEPSRREDGALIISLDVEIIKYKHFYRNGEYHHVDRIEDMELTEAPKYIQKKLKSIM